MNRDPTISVKGTDVTQDTIIHSPCSGTCQIDIDTGFCYGCYRTLDEVAGWVDMTRDEKLQLLTLIEERKKEAD